MSNNSTKDKWPIRSMRWVARFLSISWAYWTLLITWFCAGTGYVEGNTPLALYMAIVFAASVLLVGAAIIASVWKMEVLGGTVLLADCVVIIVCIIVSPHTNPTFVKFFTPSHLPFNFTLVLPPLLAGSLFITCHRISKKSQVQCI